MKKQTQYIVREALTRRFNKGRGNDDFDWKHYNTHYRGELEDIAKTHVEILQAADYSFDEPMLTSHRTERPLHPNHHLLYETILQLAPRSVLEAGCGGGDHLHNLNILAPQLQLCGVDLSEAQLAFLHERHPGLDATIQQRDLTLPNPIDAQPVDLAYTQAVLMHIRTGNGHLVALANLFSSATKQVLLMENWTRNDYLDDIRILRKKNIIAWQSMYFYYRVSRETTNTRLMIVSATPLPMYPPLTSYSLLTSER